MNKFIIIGTGGFAREVYYILKNSKFYLKNKYLGDSKKDYFPDIVGFTTNNKIEHTKMMSMNDFKQIKIIGDIDKLKLKKYDNYNIIISIGNSNFRNEIHEKLIEINPTLNYPIIISNKSTITDKTIINTIKEGTIICPNCSITTNIKIGKFNIINQITSIGHDSVIGDYCTISPNVTISGNSTIENCVEMGSSSSTIPGINIKHNSIVGAGAVVTKNFEKPSLIVGVPGVVKKEFWNYV